MALIYCPECGKQVSDSADACPSCGYPLSNLHGKAGAGAADYSKPEQGKYNVFLTDAGDSVTGTAQILCDVCGYTYQDAYDLASNLPTIVVYNATLTQAKAAANALADYGLDVSVYDDNGYVPFDDLEYDETQTTTTDNGIEISADLARVLNTLTVENLIRSAFIRSYSYPYPYEYILPYRRRHLFYYQPPLYRRPSFFERLLGFGPRSYGPRGYVPHPTRQAGGGFGNGKPSGPRRPSGGFGSFGSSPPTRPSGSSRSFGSGVGSFRSGSRSSGGSGSLFGGGRSSGSRSGGFGSSSSRSGGFGGARSSGVGRIGGSSKGGGFGGGRIGGSSKGGGFGGRGKH